MIAIDHKKCIRCLSCVDECPTFILNLVENEVICTGESSCIECYHCVAICPREAITCDKYSLEEFYKNNQDNYPDIDQIFQLIRNRRSIRTFLDKEVPEEILLKLIALSSCAPSGKNEQGVEFLVITNKSVINALEEKMVKKFLRFDKLIGTMFNVDFSRFKDENKKVYPVFRNAPVLIVAHCDKKYLSGKENCILAMYQLVIASQAYNLGTAWIGYLPGIETIFGDIKKDLEIPANNLIHASVIIGWPKYRYTKIIPGRSITTTWRR